MGRLIAVIPTDLSRSRLGLASMLDRRIAGRTVLAHTVARAVAVEAVEKVVLVHPVGQDPLATLQGERFSKPVEAFADDAGLTDARHAQRTAARKWSLYAWRGGLGGGTCYDELLPAGPLVAALLAHDAESGLLVGADWCVVGPGLCDRVAAVHLENPQAFQMVFTQAPPGLAGVVVGRDLLAQMAEHGATFGQLLAYNPLKPQADPIGRDVCVQIDPAVRSCARRFIYDTPRDADVIDRAAEAMGASFGSADAAVFVATVREVASGLGRLPQQVTLELTPQRLVTGPIAPQHHVAIDRPPMTLDLAQRVIDELATEPDTALTLGGLGDALLHDDWQRLVRHAHDAGVFGVAIETDLLVDDATVDALLDSPIDVVSVRLNADRAQTYARVCGRDDFAKVIANLERLINGRNRRAATDSAASGRPWIVPRLVKTPDTLADMETFFDRWMHYTGHAVIEPPADGCGSMPRHVVGDMPRPRRRPCRQAGGVRETGGRLTVFSDGRVPWCDEDWLAQTPAGDANDATLGDIWRRVLALADSDGDSDAVLCDACRQWYGVGAAVPV
jgi:hypothetical protein